VRLTASVINKLRLARHLFWIAADGLESHREIALFATVNLMQDSVEAFLLAASEHVNAGIDGGTTFERYFSKIDERICPKTLPFRSKLIALNKVRIAAKHHGVKPDRTEVEGFALVCREFFDASCLLVFGVQFWSVSLIDLLNSGEAKEHLIAAQNAFDSYQWFECMVECRKVIFLEFEEDYDIARFKNGRETAGVLVWTSAPFYATEKSYFDKSVNTPFDYIVLDHRKLDSELISNGIDTHIFWNIWRLTPSVYRFREKYEFVGDWLVKRELKKEQAATEENAAYVLEQTIDVALHLEQRRRLLRYTGRGGFYIRLKRDGVNVYAKADRYAAVSVVTEPGLRQLDVDYSTIGLSDSETYWHVAHATGIGSDSVRFYYGFVHEGDVDWSVPAVTALSLPSA
jgi:hypothetical protein